MFTRTYFLKLSYGYHLFTLLFAFCGIQSILCHFTTKEKLKSLRSWEIYFSVRCWVRGQRLLTHSLYRVSPFMFSNEIIQKPMYPRKSQSAPSVSMRTLERYWSNYKTSRFNYFVHLICENNENIRSNRVICIDTIWYNMYKIVLNSRPFSVRLP